ncbi:coiled-coil domain-containing protein 186 [Amyelois transitella]|uniref:coiled-coil domain-containing protein 186 n=1 Tax=Amyelois transitella TaxID=680683 RepID=UPI00298FDCBF|nr:coiled-coil domain-containing protein 186 [Amyelois transitella]
MSQGPEENPIHTDKDIVAISKENGSLCEITDNSGVVTNDACSVVGSASSDSEESPSKHSETLRQDIESISAKVVQNESVSTHSSLVSHSPDSDDLSDVLVNRSDTQTNENNHVSLDKDDNEPIEVIIQPCTKENKVTFPATDHDDKNNFDLNTDLNNFTNKALTTSTTSLDHQRVQDSISKSPLSRSAEDISKVELPQEKLNLSAKELNTEEILAQFVSQKPKAGATQKIIDSPQIIQNLDVRYAKIPKELLSQDLGSIVKNVHGIFSSVSGSLKSAYNSSQRVLPQQKAPVKLVKNLPNGKVMKDIFEDELTEDRPQIISVEKTNESEILNTKSDLNLESEGEDVKGDVLKLQVESLEKLLAEQRKENGLLRDRVKQQLDELQERDQTFKELEVKLDLMSKRVEQAEREKDAAVMRYASVECAAIEAKRAAEKAAAAERAAVSETELLSNKLKSAHVEKQRICQLYDDKCHELSNKEREVAKVREELRELEGRLKWTQSKLRVEMDAYKDSSERAEKLSQQLAELEAAKENAAVNAAELARTKQLETELKECRADLILCRHEREELEKRLTTANQQLESCRRERDGYSEALTRTTAEVEKLKMSNLQLEEEAAELAALRAQAALADTLSAQLQRESERALRAEEALVESQALAQTCARREALALEHAARLTAAHVAERARAQQTDGKAQALTADNASLREQVKGLEAEVSKLTAALSEEVERRNKENRVLARKVAELTEEVAEANKKLEWEKGENGVLKKKHASAVKELNRELQRALKRCEQLEAKLTPPDATSTRTGSVSSLSSGESAAVEERLQNGHDALPDIQVREPDKQALIERIVSLQRAAARRAERCEFLEEHSKQLTDELRAKSRLLRQLLLELPADTVTSQRRDINKKEMARLGGGAMAAVWGGSADGMTLDLSLEMNRRLQAVLEDALLKNITLKENMDTLGAEISRLKEQIKQDKK